MRKDASRTFSQAALYAASFHRGSGENVLTPQRIIAGKTTAMPNASANFFAIMRKCSARERAMR